MDYLFISANSPLLSKVEAVSAGYQVPGGVIVPETFFSESGLTLPRDINIEKYQPVLWPDIQDFMLSMRFEECILINDDKGYHEFGDSAYWIPVDINPNISTSSIQNCLQTEFADIINQTDNDSGKWYELRIQNTEEPITVHTGRTFAEVFELMDEAILQYGYSHINIAIFESQSDGSPHQVLKMPSFCKQY